MMCTVGLIIEALWADMMMILSLLLRMAETVVKTGIFKIISVSRPDRIDKLCIIGIENTHAICQYSNMPQAYSSGCAGILLRGECYFINEILILRYIGIAPRAYTIAGYTEATDINIGAGVLFLDDV